MRTFARGDRLLIRVPAFDMSGAARGDCESSECAGQPCGISDALQATAARRVAQFGLPLSWLVPGEYQIELQGANGKWLVKQRISFKVTS